MIGSATSASASSYSPNIFDILSQGGDITFVGGASTEQSLVIGPPSFAYRSSQETGLGAGLLNFGADAQGTAVAPLDIPDGATIESYQCAIQDSDSDGSITCRIFRNDFGVGASAESLETIFTSGFDGGQTTLSSGALSIPVDRDNFAYGFSFETNSCEDSCNFFTAKITYSVPSGMIVGGSFYQVDNVSLMLAFTIVNSYWMAPLAVGVGVGVYLIQRKKI